MEQLQTSKTLSILIVWSVLWLLVAGGSIYILPDFGADQLNRFYITSAYFLTFALLGGYYYKLNNMLSHKAPLHRQFIFIILISSALILACLFINAFFQLNPEAAKKIILSKFYFPLFQIETVITKICDVSFQQVFIFGVLKKLKEDQQSDERALIFFSLCFFAVHLPLIFSLSPLYAFYFIIPSMFAGLIFSYCILKYRYGLSMSFAVHLLFYLTIGIYLRA